MLLLTQITKWVDQRDSTKRKHKRDEWELGYREFLINPNRITNLKVHGTGSSFLFSDNHRDRREGNSYVESNSTVAEIIATHDTPHHSNMITLPFCPKNDPRKTPVDYTLDVEDLAYFDAYNAPPELGLADPDKFCWLVYNKKAFKRVEQLVAYSLREIEDIDETGTTSTTTTTTAARTTAQ